jgi:hypothetical protein
MRLAFSEAALLLLLLGDAPASRLATAISSTPSARPSAPSSLNVLPQALREGMNRIATKSYKFPQCGTIIQ